jgi:hypothetical protein
MNGRVSVPFALWLVLILARAAEGQQLFSNFPVNGQISAFQIGGSYSASDSFTLTSGGTLGQVQFGAWVSTGDSVTGVAWSIGTTPFDASLGTGVASATSAFDLSNADGFDVNTVSFAIPGVTLPAGTYYLTLSSAVSAASNPVYWDINDGAGIDAWDSTFGHVSASNTCFNVVGISGTCASSFQLLSTVPSAVTFSPTSLIFSNQTVGTTSAAQTITLTNGGPNPLAITGIAMGGTNPGDFAQTNNCPATVAVNGTCTINVTFTPTAANARSAAVMITDNGAGSPQSVGVSGTGTAVPSAVTFAPTSLSFANQTVGTTSAAETITLTNGGPNPLAITGIAMGGMNPGDFAHTNNCPATVAVNGTCTINVTFTPTAANARSAAVVTTDNGAGSPQSVGVSGTGTAVPSTVTFAPTSLSFANQTVGTTSAAQTITLTNGGPNSLAITGIAMGGTNPGDFAQTNNCPATVAVSGTCTISVTFTPTAANARSAAVVITDNGAGSPQSAALNGTGVAPPPPTWPNGYMYQATFTVAAGQAPGTQTNFPALISGTFSDFATTVNGGRISNTCEQTVGNNLTAVPCDLIFTSDAAGTVPLSWEFENWTPATGAVNIWVNVPTLNSGTVIYAWYGKPSVDTFQTTPSATWNNSFMAVYHLKENPAGTAPQLNDSTANGNSATMNGAVLASQQQPGEIGGSVNFEGDTWAGLANPGNFSFERTDSFSLSGWFKIASNSSGTLLSKFPGPPTPGWLLTQSAGASAPGFQLILFGGTTGGGASVESPAVTIGAWHYVVVTYSGTSSAAGIQIYVDGVNQSLTTLNNTLTGSILNSSAAAINGRDGPTQMSTDTMDEVRVSTKGVVFSPAWVTTSFNNESHPATFFSAVTGLTFP